jgi:hypothetical protein
VLLFVLAAETNDWFSWTIQPPLTAAFLGASYWAAAVLFGWTLRRDGPARTSAALVPVGSIAVLLLIATLIHWDRFHDDLFGWFWRAAYLTVPVTLAVVTPRALRAARAAGHPPRWPLPDLLRAPLALQGVVMLVLGLYLFIAPTSADALWPWDLTPLTARAIGAFVAGFGASALHAVVANDLVRFDGAALAYAALGALELLAVARYAGDFTGADTDSWVFVLFLASVLATGLYGANTARRISVRPARR